jgi:hypothetical protein
LIQHATHTITDYTRLLFYGLHHSLLLVLFVTAIFIMLYCPPGRFLQQMRA